MGLQRLDEQKTQGPLEIQTWTENANSFLQEPSVRRNIKTGTR
jgi:hypothetical protein